MKISKRTYKLTAVLAVLCMALVGAIVVIDNASSDALNNSGLTGGSGEYHGNVTSGESVTINLSTLTSAYSGSKNWAIYNSMYISGLSISGTTLSGSVTSTAPQGTSNNLYISLSGQTSNNTEIYLQIYFHFLYNVNFSTNGGSGSIPSQNNLTSTFTLPAATRSGYVFDGWYSDANSGTKIGVAGATVNVSTLTAYTVTLYAHWSIPQVTVSNGSTQVVSGGYLDWAPTVTPSNAVLAINTNTTGCSISSDLVSGKYRLRGILDNILPGTYYVSFTASASGYDSKTVQLTITVPVFVYEPLTDTIPINSIYSYSVTANPASSKIISYTVWNGSSQITTGFTVTTANKSMTALFPNVGTYTVRLLIGASGYTSTTKDIVLDVYDPQVIVGDPIITSVSATVHQTLPGGYYLTAIGVSNYTSVTWNFGDGSSSASGLNVVHQYTTSGEKTATVTAYNQYNGHTAMKTATFSVVIPEQYYNDAWVSIEYSYAFATASLDDLGSYELVTDVVQGWLSLTTFSEGGTDYVLLSGTPLPGNANDEYTITINSSSGVQRSWGLHVWPNVDDSNITTGFTVNVDGYVVTLLNNGPKDQGIIMYVDWGTTDLASGTKRQASNSVATATYEDDGQYRVTMTLVLNGQEYSSWAFVTVPSTVTSYTIYYNNNGGVGDIAPQNGHNLTVAVNSFTYEGHTFVRWNSAADGHGVNYEPGAQITLTDNVTLYAIWSGTAAENNSSNSGGFNWFWAFVAVLIVAIAWTAIFLIWRKIIVIPTVIIDLALWIAAVLIYVFGVA